MTDKYKTYQNTLKFFFYKEWFHVQIENYN